MPPSMSPLEPGPTFFSTSTSVQAKPKETVKKGLHKVDRVASKVALKGLDAGVTATKKTKKTLGIIGDKKQNGGRKNGGVGVKKNGDSLKGRR
ncbi:hypothetical protein KEM56_002655 [Ascosphaera pollenicola]|nr:hypothetical protein KEM56_002655 [Ascosphaera pollenicola]